jgi:hypothetical protein
LLAIGVVLVIAVVMAAGSFLTARLCIHALRRSCERRAWNDLAARHRELDRELTRIWERR